MKQGILIFIFFLITNQVIASELDDAIKYGQLLTSAVKEKGYIRYKKHPQYKEIKTFLAENKCLGAKYKAYIIGSEAQQYFYLLASKGKSLILGRHFKAPINGGVIDISAFVSSTNSCLNLGVVKKGMVAMTATHLKPFPSEFHVLQSNLRVIPLYIMTTKAVYKIEADSVELVKEGGLEAKQAELSDNKPKDKPVSVTSKEQMEAFFKAQELYNKQALESYPQVKDRFLAGLPEGESFYLTTRLYDNESRVEQVFVLVKSIKQSIVSGIISNEINVVSGFESGQDYEFSEDQIYDWLIVKPDGSEEGNFVGKYIDSLQ